MFSRILVAVATLATSVFSAPLIWAQGAPYPTRTVTIVVPLAPGGGVDTIARVFAEKLRDRLGQPVVVENRPGAGGVLGSDYVAKSAPDGYTLLMTTNAEVLAKFLHKSVPFDVTKDFASVSLLATAPMVLLASPNAPVKSFPEVIAYAKANPGKLSYGTPGVGSPHHFAGEMLKKTAGIDLVHVPYRGTGPALTDLLASQIPLLFATTIAVMPHIEAGKIRVLASGEVTRSALLAQVPTIAESGLPNFSIDAWFGVVAPAGTPASVIARLNEALIGVGDMPEVRNRLTALGYNMILSSPERLREVVLADHEKYGNLIPELGLR